MVCITSNLSPYAEIFVTNDGDTVPSIRGRRFRISTKLGVTIYLLHNYIDSNLNLNANIFHVKEDGKSHGHACSISINGDFNNSNLTSTEDLVGKESPNALNSNVSSINKKYSFNQC